MRALGRRTLLLTLLFSAAAFAVMIPLILSGRGAVTDAAYAAEALPADAGYEVVRLIAGDAAGDIVIPLPEDVHYEDIRFENHYLTPQLIVYLDTADTTLYERLPVTCAPDKVTSVRCLALEEGGVALSFALDALYEPSPEILDDTVTISLVHPAQRYDKIVIVDPSYSGTGTDTALALAERLRTLAKTSGDGMRIYLTRTEDAQCDEEDALLLAERTGATRYLRLQLTSGESALSSAASFYDGYYIRGFGNDDFAASLQQHLSGIDSLTAGDVRYTAGDDMLNRLKMTACALRIDGVRGAEGAYDTLLDDIARVIYDCLLKGYQ